MGTLALDGTKLAANAAKRKTLTAVQIQEELSRLDGQVTELLRCAQAADQNDTAPDQLPVELAQVQSRRARLPQAKAQLEQQAHVRYQRQEEQRQQRLPGDRPRRIPPEPRSTDTLNPTDPDSTLTPTAQARYIQGYNAQLEHFK